MRFRIRDFVFLSGIKRQVRAKPSSGVTGPKDEYQTSVRPKEGPSTAALRGLRAVFRQAAPIVIKNAAALGFLALSWMPSNSTASLTTHVQDTTSFFFEGSSQSLPKAMQVGDKGIARPDHLAIRYVGRIDRQDPKAPKLSWPGSSIQTLMKTTSLKIHLDDPNRNYFRVTVRDASGQNVIRPFVFRGGPKMTQELFRDLPWALYGVEVFKNSEARIGTATFEGFEASEGAEIASPPGAKRQFVFYGDSITVGASNKTLGIDQWEDVSTHDHSAAYGAVLSRWFHADYSATAVSGIGLVKSVGGNPTMMSWWDKVSPSDSSRGWEFSDSSAQVVVINLGQNDFWQGVTSEFGPAYEAFLSKIRGRYPKAEIFCVLGPMSVAQNESYTSYIQHAVDARRAQGDTQIHFHVFRAQSEQHPRASVHLQMARELSQRIKPFLK